MRCSMALLLLMLCVSASPQSGINLAELRNRCLPGAPMSTLAAIVQAESAGNANALQIDFPNERLRRWHMRPGSLRLSRQPRDHAEALAWKRYLATYDISVDIGLMQVSAAEAARRHIDPATLFDPCTNIRVGWTILGEDYARERDRYEPGQTALQHALSRYNTGDSERGLENGYVQRVERALAGLSRQEQQR